MGRVVQITPLSIGRSHAIMMVVMGIGLMFLRRHREEKSGETYEYWTLVESVRTASGPRQQSVATLGKRSAAKHSV
jgi:hypothetical protein